MQSKRRMSRWVKIGFGAIGIGLLLTIGIAVLVIIGTQLYGMLWHHSGSGRISYAKVQISNFDEALAIFHNKLGRYPSSEEGLEILANMPERRKPLMPSISVDPWGNDYVYMHPGKYNQWSFDISSKGPDGLLGTEDDIRYKDLQDFSHR
jgi:general secretion pathway protein G